MTKGKNIDRRQLAIEILIFLLVGGLVYLFHITQIGYTNDDWYLMYAGKVGGPGAFQSLFSFDRPLRASVLGPAYALFGENAVFYNLSALALRVLSAAFFLWTLRMLWPRQRKATLAMALLYLVYPGFLSQTNGIDYLPVMISLAAAMLSLALTVLAFYEKRVPWRVSWVCLAIVLGWVYVGLVEYEAAFEFMRLGILFVIVSRQIKNWWPRVTATLIAWLPYLLVPAVYLMWNLFLFEGRRQATSLASQFQVLVVAPIQTTFEWMANLVMSWVNVLFSAWIVPLYQMFSQIPAGTFLFELLTTGLIVAAYLLLVKRIPNSRPAQQSSWQTEALWLGLLIALAGPLPIVLANREIVFPGLSRYALVSSGGVAMLAIALLHHVTSLSLRRTLLAVLLALGILTHFANGALKAQETASLREFWWQVSWRIPQMELNTTLVANYAQAGIEEEYFVWSPANLIYYPEKTNKADYLQPALFAAVPNDTTVQKVLTGEGQDFYNRRTIRTYANYRNILVITQPSANSCVQVIDGTQPELSPYESAKYMAVAPYSEIDHVLANEAPQLPPMFVFGAEPEHSWCYLYEKASLARQQGDWGQVLALGEQAFGKGLLPRDPIEWMPFIQVYAQNQQWDRLNFISQQLSEQYFVRSQACNILGGMEELKETIQQIRPLFCSEG